MIGDNYLHVQRWRHNFVADSTKITSLPVWVRFSWLPVEYYTEEWLWSAGNTIGKPIKIDDTMLVTSRGRFARICVEIDLEKPLVASYRIRGREGGFQYEGLHNLFYMCGKYGHREIQCHLSREEEASGEEQPGNKDKGKEASTSAEETERKGGFGPWLVAQRTSRRQPRVQKGSLGNSGVEAERTAAADKGKPMKSKAQIGVRNDQGVNLQSKTLSTEDRVKSTARKEKVATMGREESSGRNGQSRSCFEVLAVLSEMDVDGVAVTDAGVNGSKEPVESDEDESCEEVVMETREGAHSEARVQMSVSHPNLADQLRPLGSTKVDIRSLGQNGSGGPRRRSEGVLKEVTNNLAMKPSHQGPFPRQIWPGDGRISSGLVRRQPRPQQLKLLDMQAQARVIWGAGRVLEGHPIPQIQVCHKRRITTLASKFETQN